MTKGKYTPENVDRCLQAIALHGTDKAGYESVPINKATFYCWFSDKPEFREGVLDARSRWQTAQGTPAKLQAWEVLRRYLFEGQVVHWTIVKDAMCPDGTIVQLTETRTIRKPTPQWVIDRYLGKTIHELEALNAIAQWLPAGILEVIAGEINGSTEAIREAFTGALPAGGGAAAKPGLSDDVAAAIRAKILGIEVADSEASLRSHELP
jgi:AcrR family transcriptional regulator